MSSKNGEGPPKSQATTALGLLGKVLLPIEYLLSEKGCKTQSVYLYKWLFFVSEGAKYWFISGAR